MTTLPTLFELPPALFDRVQPLYAAAPFDQPCYDVVFAGWQAARIFVDDADAPTSALMCRSYEFFPAGAVDPAFGINISWSGAAPAQILAMTLQPDGKLLIAGQFDNVGGMSTPLLARLDLPDLLFRDGFE